MPKAAVFRTLGASNHSKGKRAHKDFYSTDPQAVEMLLQLEPFSDRILEPACGVGHICEVLKKHGKKVKCSDIVYRGYGEQKDFFKYRSFKGDIITNPPYSKALEFVEHSLRIIPKGNKVAMLLRLLFLEGKARGEFFKRNPPKTVYVSRSRIVCARNGDFKKYNTSAQAYAWFVWQKGHKGNTTVKWFN